MCLLEPEKDNGEYGLVGSCVCVCVRECVRVCVAHPQDEADGDHPRRGHDLGAVGHQVEERGHDALRPVVKLVAQ